MSVWFSTNCLVAGQKEEVLEDLRAGHGRVWSMERLARGGQLPLRRRRGYRAEGGGEDEVPRGLCLPTTQHGV